MSVQSFSEPSEDMTYSAQFIADYFLTHTTNHLTPMHMIKMTYIAHGYTLAIHKKPLVLARIEAWRHGPVIPVLYQTYKGHGGNNINQLNYCGTMLGNEKFEERKKFIEDLIDNKICNILNQIIHHFSKLTSLQLSTLTHQKGTPWDQCYTPDKLFTLIPNSIIQEFYEQKMVDNGRQGY